MDEQSVYIIRHTYPKRETIASIAEISKSAQCLPWYTQKNNSKKLHGEVSSVSSYLYQKYDDLLTIRIKLSLLVQGYYIGKAIKKQVRTNSMGCGAEITIHKQFQLKSNEEIVIPDYRNMINCPCDDYFHFNGTCSTGKRSGFYLLSFYIFCYPSIYLSIYLSIHLSVVKEVFLTGSINGIHISLNYQYLTNDT